LGSNRSGYLATSQTWQPRPADFSGWPWAFSHQSPTAQNRFAPNGGILASSPRGGEEFSGLLFEVLGRCVYAHTMWRDIALAIGGFLVQCGLAFLGLKLSKWKHKLAFGSLVIVGAVVTGVAVKRGVDTSTRLETPLKKIEAELQDLHSAAPKHYEVGLNEDLRTGKSTSTVHLISDAEYQRRHKVLNALRIEYILSHHNVPPRVLAGIEWPPLEWINRRLAELKEPWTVLSGNNPWELQFHELKP
jgi:hypothetical protein